jgi:phage-related protein
MADSNDENLVSQIQVTGGEESAKNIETFADRGAAAFQKLDAAANKASGDIQKSTADIAKTSTNAQKSVQAMNGIDLSKFKDGVSKIQDGVSQLNAQFPKLTQAVGRFAQRMAIMATGAVAAGVGLAAAARNVVKAIDGQSDALDKQVQSQIDANNQALSAEEAQINLESSLRKLNQQLATGQISYADYSKAVQQLKADYNEQRRVADEVAQAQQRVKEENDRLTKSLADRKAYQGLIDTFGGPLVTAMAAFGRTAEQVRVQLVNAFGPGLAALIDKINDVITKNSGSITNFINTAGAKLNELVTKNGPALEKFFSNVGKAAASIATALIDAAPSIVDLFNNVIVPAVEKVAALFGTLASAINAVFGTKLTGGSVFLVAVIAQMSGSLRLLFALLKSGGAIFKTFTGILGTVAELMGAAFGGKVGAQIAKFGISITTATGPMKAFFAILKSGVPLIVTLAEVVATGLGVSFAVALPIVVALGAALIYLATQVDWKKFGADASDALSGLVNWLKQTWTNAQLTANGIRGAWAGLGNFFSGIASSIAGFFSGLWAVLVAGWQVTATGVQTAWQAVVDFFSTVASSVSQFFVDLWNNVVAGVGTAVAALEAAWGAVASWFQTSITAPIAAYFTTLWTNLTTGVTAAITAIQTAWAAIVGFFQGVWANISAVFTSAIDTIVGYWSAGIDKIKGFFSALYDSAKSYLQPILDLLNSIASASASTDTSGGGAGFAGGGPITGPGTGTSDSIPMWGSNGEFMVKARAVAKYGLGFMHQVNSGRFQIPRFAEGGLVSIAPSPVPSFDGVGGSERPVALQPLNLSLFGEEFKGLMMPNDVGQRMTKFAIAKQTRSAGRKPAWIGRGRT